MSRPRLLDLFCGAGGAAMGYHRAGFEVVGVDIKPQPNYPFEFHRGDALTWPLGGYDAIHASPPCQGYSRMAVLTGRLDYPLLIEPMRDRLRGLPYVIENVERAPLIDPVVLCGTQFGLEVRRHRLFEFSPDLTIFAMLPSCTCLNGVAEGRLISHRNGGRVREGRRRPPRYLGSEMREAMDCGWMTVAESQQAIPPAYTQWTGRRLMEALGFAPLLGADNPPGSRDSAEQRP